MKVSGKVVLVTGAGSGMGRELTLELVRRGAKVIAADMRSETLEETKRLAGAGSVITFKLDVTDFAAVEGLPTRIAAENGEIDILINNAGIIQPFVPIKDLTIEQAEKVMNVNFYGPLHMIKVFLPALLKRPEAHILNVSSMGAYAPVPGQSVYGASKAAVKLLTEGLRSELIGTSVGVTVAFPGAVATNITTNSGLAMPANADEQSSKFKSLPAPVAAKIMIDAIEKNKARVTVGKDATMMDRLSRLNPVFAANLIYKQMKSLLQ
jgi:NAD(P)-dependent dehydrogenase (short-subunit alcohol dehydrogenase family)